MSGKEKAYFEALKGLQLFLSATATEGVVMISGESTVKGGVGAVTGDSNKQVLVPYHYLLAGVSLNFGIYASFALWMRRGENSQEIAGEVKGENENIY